MVLAGALAVLAGVLVAWSLSRAADRVSVVSTAQPVVAGHEFTIDDLQLTNVAIDADVAGLVPARSIDELVGRVAAIDLRQGVLLSSGMWRQAPRLADGEQAVGVVVKAGRAPASLSQGDRALAAALDPALKVDPITVRVLDAIRADDTTTSFTLAVAGTDAVTVAQLAANDQLVLVGTTMGGAG
jgi:hypothetical protein